MALDIDADQLRSQLSSVEPMGEGTAFAILKQIALLASSEEVEDVAAARDLAIRMLERQRELNGLGPALSSIVHEVGLYPYLDPTELPTPEVVGFEAHRPFNMEDADLVFHEVQASVYRRLLDRQNVILSAPTSFGKSLLIDALLATGNYDNCVIVVPTIALMDETRRRLSRRFASSFKVITHISQEPSDRNIFVLTQERVVDHPNLPKPDLFVIDEFYKLDARTDPERGFILNQAFYKLWKTGAQFYLLGPNVQAIPESVPGTIRAEFISTSVSTVAVNLHRVETPQGDRHALVDLARSLEDPTLIFCRSPKRTREAATWLLEGEVASLSDELADAADWVGETYHPDWLVTKSLRHGVGIHHGRLPRALAHWMVRAFNEGQLRFLVCTSTLIEGVNTSAKNVVVLDNQIATNRIDYFTFSNIRGRSGRMFRHFTGNVFIFHEPPAPELPFVDFPVMTQPDRTPTSLLIEVDEPDLSKDSRRRIDPILSQESLPMSVIRENAGVDPERQIGVARELESRAFDYHPLLAWRGVPDYEQLEATCVLIWDGLLGSPSRRAGVSSGRQLAFKLNQLRGQRSIPHLLGGRISDVSAADDVDEAVEQVLHFLRQWPGYEFPRLLTALERIQRVVFEAIQLRPGSYGPYAAQVENLFLPPPLAALEEYGVPIQLAEKLAKTLRPTGDLDEVLERLGLLSVRELPISTFERSLVADAQEGLGKR